MSPTRTFIVRVSESSSRVLLEDVRERRQAVAADLHEASAQISRWLAEAGRAEAEDGVRPDA